VIPVKDKNSSEMLALHEMPLYRCRDMCRLRSTPAITPAPVTKQPLDLVRWLWGCRYLCHKTLILGNDAGDYGSVNRESNKEFVLVPIG